MCASLRVSLPRCDYTPTDLPAPSQQQQKINKPHNFLSHFNHITLPNRMLAINRWCLLLFIWLFVFSKWWMKRLAATIARQRNKNSFCACVYINTYTYIYICTAQDLFYNLSSAMYKIIVCSLLFWQQKQIPPSPLCCTACGPPSEGLVTKQIRQDIYRCEKMHFSNTVWNSSVKCALSNKPVHNGMRESRRERETESEGETERENPRSELSCFLALYFKRSWGVAERKS